MACCHTFYSNEYFSGKKISFYFHASAQEKKKDLVHWMHVDLLWQHAPKTVDFIIGCVVTTYPDIKQPILCFLKSKAITKHKMIRKKVKVSLCHSNFIFTETRRLYWQLKAAHLRLGNSKVPAQVESLLTACACQTKRKAKQLFTRFIFISCWFHK